VEKLQHKPTKTEQWARELRVLNRYWKPTLSDTKQRLRLAFGKACQVASIQLIHVPDHTGIWKNELAEFHAKEAISRPQALLEVNQDISANESFS
jgi:hypothetical protein